MAHHQSVTQDKNNRFCWTVLDSEVYFEGLLLSFSRIKQTIKKQPYLNMFWKTKDKTANN